MRIFQLLLLLLFSLLWSPFICASASPISLSWIKFKPDTLKNWQITIDASNSGLMHIRPRQASAKKPLEKKVFILLAKKSGSYQLAIETFLQVMFRNNIATTISVMQFNKDSNIGKQALKKAQQQNVDLIFSIGSESAALVHQHFVDKKIPVVTSTNKDPVLLGQVDNYHTGSGHNIAYTSLNIPIDVQLNYLLTLRPKLKVIGLLFNKNHQQVMTTEVQPLKKKLQGLGLDVIDIAVSSAKKAKAELQLKMPNAIIAMQKIDPQLKNSLLWITSSTAIFTQIATINQFSGNIPVLSSIPNSVTEGKNSAVLAIGIDRRNNARLASLYAVKILTGLTTASELMVGVVSPPDIAINFLVAKKIGLKIPFQFFESASFIYNYQGSAVRMYGQKVQ